MRVHGFDGIAGVFAATACGLFHSADGETWVDLGVPREKVYSVAASPDGDRVYAGTRPARVYVADWPDGGVEAGDGAGGRLAWTDCEGFQALPSREEWRTPRHEDIAQVRSLCTHPDAPERIVAGVEVGGVHYSDDGGDTWQETTGVHDDVHHLHVTGADEWVAATGAGLYHTVDAGGTWTRVDPAGDCDYFREAFTAGDTLYAGGARGPSTTWDEAADYALFAGRPDSTLEPVAYPVPDEVLIGWCDVDGTVVGATHDGTLLAERDGTWERAGSVPVPGETLGRYLQLAVVGD